MKKVFTLAAIATGLWATPAFAQSAGGFYIGAVAGFEGIDVETADGSANASADSAVYGIAAGYDVSLGGAFIGVEGEYSVSEGTTEFPDSVGAAREGLESDGQYYLGLRAGFALTDGITGYGKVGYTALDTTAFTTSGSIADLEESTDGFRIGGGLQIQLPGPLEARVEYRRSEYGDLGGEAGDVTTDQVVAGVGLRF